MLVKLWMAAFNRTLGDRIDSETLIATAPGLQKRRHHLGLGLGGGAYFADDRL